MRISSLLFSCVALSVSVAAVACGNSGDSTPATNPATGPAQGGGGTTGAGGDAQGGTTSAGGSAAGGDAQGGSGTAGAGDLAISGCTHDTAEDHTGDATVTITTPAMMTKFTPNCIKVKVGATVTFPNSATHPLLAMTAHGTQPNPISDVTPAAPTAAMIDVSFGNEGSYGYYCKNHGSDSATPGMSGAVFVDP